MSDDSLIFVVEEDEAGRADHVVGLRFPDASRKRLAALFAEGLVRVDGKKAKKGHVVRAGQTVRLDRSPESEEERKPLPEEGELEVVHEDSDLVVLAKAAGMPTHPLKAGELGTLANLLVHRYPECLQVGDDPREAGMAHRLDIDTSGLIIAARNPETWSSLRHTFASGGIEKSYLAVVHDRPFGTECEEPLLQQGKRVQIDYAGLDAHTSWSEIERNESFALLRCQAHTGRMHQVRAHLAHCGSAIVGDTLYGGQTQEGFAGHFLHAAELSFAHPLSGETLTLRAPLPADRSQWLEAQGLHIPEPASS